MVSGCGWTRPRTRSGCWRGRQSESVRRARRALETGGTGGTEGEADVIAVLDQVVIRGGGVCFGPDGCSSGSSPCIVLQRPWRVTPPWVALNKFACAIPDWAS